MLFLALRHLFSKKKQTVLTLMGIVMGTAAYVAISGMMLGFQVFIIDQLVNNDAHIRISAREELVDEKEISSSLYPENLAIRWIAPPSGRKNEQFIEYPQGWFERLEAEREVLAYSPQLTAQVLFSRGNVSLTGRLIGSDPNKQSLVSNIEKYMKVGSFRNIGQSGNKIVVGQGLLTKLGARVSENLQIATGKGTPVPFKIVGAFKTGVRAVDESTAFGALADVQLANLTPSRISDIAVKLVDVNQATNLSNSWSDTSRSKVQSWEQVNEGIMSVFQTQDIIRNAMTISILIVAGFGIYNILSMAVSQRRREIAILRSMGYEPGDIIRLFLIQGVILGTAGGLIGVFLGWLVCVYMSQIELSQYRQIGDGHMLISFDGVTYVKAFALAFFSSTFASWLPSRGAGKLNPIDIIRSEAQ